MNARNWFLVAALIFLGLMLQGLAVGGIYTVGYAARGVTYQMNRFTGSLKYCTVTGKLGLICVQAHQAR